jgi:shikimate kinase
MMGSENIILIGFMGSGKSSVGKRLAEKLGYNFRDTDEMIVATEGLEIQEIFRKYGEVLFRNLETTLLVSITDTLEKTVLSTGGGIPTIDRNINLLRVMGQLIYLQASKNTIIERLAGDTTRPLLMGENPKERIEKLLNERRPIYERAADVIINTDRKTIDDIVNEIIERQVET